MRVTKYREKQRYLQLTACASRGGLVVPYKAGCADKPTAVFNTQVSGHPDIEWTNILDRPRIIDDAQLYGSKDQVLISRTDASAKTKIGFIAENTLRSACDHRHLSKSKRSKAEPQEVPRCKGDCLAVKVKPF